MIHKCPTLDDALCCSICRAEAGMDARKMSTIDTESEKMLRAAINDRPLRNNTSFGVYTQQDDKPVPANLSVWRFRTADDVEFCIIARDLPEAVRDACRLGPKLVASVEFVCNAIQFEKN